MLDLGQQEREEGTLTAGVAVPQPPVLTAPNFDLTFGCRSNKDLYDLFVDGLKMKCSDVCTDAIVCLSH